MKKQEEDNTIDRREIAVRKDVSALQKQKSVMLENPEVKTW